MKQSSKAKSSKTRTSNSKSSSKKARATKSNARYITRLAEDLKKFRERELSGEQITAKERKNIRARELRVMKKMKKEADPLMKEANRVFLMLEKAGLNSLTHQRVRDDFEKLGKTEFSTSDSKSYSEIVAEITRATNYLNASDTNIPAANRYIRNRDLYRKYSSQLESLTDHTYVESGLIPTEEDAKQIFANYRRIEASKQALIGRQGEKGVYGSENLILYMIDVHNRGEDELLYGHKALDEFALENLPEFKEMLDERNKVTGISGLFQKGGYYGKLEGLL